MKLTKEQIEQIRIAFQRMQSREDLLAVLNLAKSFIYGEKAIPFKLKQLTYYSNPKLGGNVSFPGIWPFKIRVIPKLLILNS